ncbi:hypothetical protein AVEN_221752-1 [Araneus ventricosus]|uniref:Uncharacterized protein n=1 Tax=Araneus ventricosus TaxID=182803 RepID=A0A4Y2FQM5_ARAVE|nr:hypothetical protein AVEN_221752-1 [Araneus ventricosus]
MDNNVRPHRSQLVDDLLVKNDCSSHSQFLDNVMIRIMYGVVITGSQLHTLRLECTRGVFPRRQPSPRPSRIFQHGIESNPIHICQSERTFICSCHENKAHQLNIFHFHQALEMEVSASKNQQTVPLSPSVSAHCVPTTLSLTVLGVRESLWWPHWRTLSWCCRFLSRGQVTGSKCRDKNNVKR